MRHDPIMCSKKIARLEAENAALALDAKRFQFLQNMAPEFAQALFWNHTSRKQRAKTIDALMAKQETT